MTSFTSGPWQAGGALEDAVKDAGGFKLAHVYYRDSYTAEAGLEHDANVSLIAAAPDLYAALEDAFGYIAGVQDGCDLPMIRAALLKARGEGA